MEFTTLANPRPDDASLMELLALKQEDALSDLYDRYGRLVYSVALNSVGDQATAEEIVQDVFVKVWEKAANYDATKAGVSTWLIRITRNRSIDELRKEKVRLDKTSISWSKVPFSAGLIGPGPEEETELFWTQNLVRYALDTLPPEQREVLALAYFKGYSHREIAELLGIPLGTVKTRVRLAMQKLRLVLSETLQEY